MSEIDSLSVLKKKTHFHNSYLQDEGLIRCHPLRFTCWTNRTNRNAFNAKWSVVRKIQISTHTKSANGFTPETCFKCKYSASPVETECWNECRFQCDYKYTHNIIHIRSHRQAYLRSYCTRQMRSISNEHQRQRATQIFFSPFAPLFEHLSVARMFNPLFGLSVLIFLFLLFFLLSFV